MQDTYVAIIRECNGNNIQMDFSDPSAFESAMKKRSNLVAWAKLFEAETGFEVTSYDGRD